MSVYVCDVGNEGDGGDVEDDAKDDITLCRVMGTAMLRKIHYDKAGRGTESGTKGGDEGDAGAIYKAGDAENSVKKN